MSKDLLILTDFIDLNEINRNILRNSDRLAVSVDAILRLKSEKIPFLTLNDLYGYRQFRAENKALIKDSEQLFSKLDILYQAYVDYPRSFTSNIYPFLIMFAELLYINKICQKIKSNYSHIYLASNAEPSRDYLNFNLEFGFENLFMTAPWVGLSNKIDILYNTLTLEDSWIIKGNEPGIHPQVNSHKLNYLTKRLFKKAFFEAAFRLKKSVLKKQGEIFVLQDGAEVKLIKKYLPEFIFHDPLPGLRRCLKNKEPLQIDFNLTGKEDITEFIERWFPLFKDKIMCLFQDYHIKIVQNIKNLLEITNGYFLDRKPAALFYSIGAFLIYEDLCAWVANNSDIPVYYFQHGGATLFHDEPYKKYIEQNSNIKKKIFLFSKVEKQLISRLGYEGLPLGSIHYQELFKEYFSKNKHKQRSVLYCSSIFNTGCFKTLTYSLPDGELFEINRDIVAGIIKLNLKMDIKLHPADETHSFRYFKNIIRLYGNKRIKLIKGIFAEAIMPNYDLLILDFIGSSLIPVSFLLKIPVILWLKDTSFLMQETENDLNQRFHLVKNNDEFEQCIRLFHEGKLESKFSLEMIDKYAFPLNNQNPGVEISNVIRNNLVLRKK